ncbi:MAG: small multi-drug export protein [Clostridiales Family XIII bacterium]|nr:small multi-drug export protein [Clostridiales Family XIII bacterium]
MNALIAFLMSMLPVVELRGGLVFASASGVPFWEAFILCCVGNILPIPFILLFLRKIFRLLERNRHTAKLITWIEDKAKRAEKKIGKYELLGLFLFVAIPLPGTGAWTGALIATVFDMRMKRVLPAIAAGVVTAGVVMSVVSYLIPGLFFHLSR